METATAQTPSTKSITQAKRQRAARIRSLMEDSGFSRKEAAAIVDAGLTG